MSLKNIAAYEKSHPWKIVHSTRSVAGRYATEEDAMLIVNEEKFTVDGIDHENCVIATSGGKSTWDRFQWVE